MNKITPKNFKNEIGNKYGRLLVTGRGENDKSGNVRWTCKCDCGRESLVKGHVLRSGKILSCGCYNREIVSQRMTTHGISKKNLKLFNVWKGMVRRCTNPQDLGFSRYGGRGITVCSRWLGENGSINFYNDMMPTWIDGLTLERIDNNKGYSPDNCKWATYKEQSYNRRNNRKLIFEGIEYSPRSLSEKFGIKFHTVRSRLVNGWTVEEIIAAGPGQYKRIIKYNGKTYSLTEFAKRFNINAMTVSYRLRNGWSLDEIVNTPVKKFNYKTSPN